MHRGARRDDRTEGDVGVKAAGHAAGIEHLAGIGLRHMGVAIDDAAPSAAGPAGRRRDIGAAAGAHIAGPEHRGQRLPGGTMAEFTAQMQPVEMLAPGGGAAWLPVRLDSYPKYYGYGPYRDV